MFHYSIIYEHSFIVRAFSFFFTLGIFQSVHCLVSQFDMVYSQEIGYLSPFDMNFAALSQLSYTGK